MKTFFLSIFIFSGISLFFSPLTSARGGDYYDDFTTSYQTEAYNPYESSLGTECYFSSASVGVGTLSNGVVVTIDSPDYAVSRCIKNTTWISYFTNFGNTVSVNASNTTLGVQIVATSMDPAVVTNLQNTQWSKLITGRSPTYKKTISPTRKSSRYIPRYTQRKSYIPVQTYPNPHYTYIPPARTYIAGSSLFNTYQMYRSLSYKPDGITMVLSSPDYTTMRHLQSYYFTGLFSDFSGVSISKKEISGGVEISVTSGSSSTVEQIQKIGYAIIYN